ncbi:MAG: PAS-domain containing protein, partial [Pseudomonadota bacterium]
SQALAGAGTAADIFKIAASMTGQIVPSDRTSIAMLNAPGDSFEAVIRYSAERGDYGPGDTEEQCAKYTALARELPGGEMQLERTRPDGAVVGVRGVATPGGGTVFTHTDITERKRAEQEIEGQSKLLAGTLENMAQGLIALDGDLTIIASNSHAAELLNTPPDMIQPGSDFGRFIRFAAQRGDFGDGDVDEIAAKQISVAKESHGEQFERRLPDGRTVEVRTTAIPGGGVIATYTDVTERKRGEERLKQLNTQLHSHAENLKRSNGELEQFAYVASHDLQEPLRMVSSYCQLLKSRYGERLDGDANEFIDFAVDGADRMKGLIQDLLAYSRVGSQGKPLEATDLDEVCDVVLHNLGMAIEDNRATIRRGSLPTVLGDRIQLVQLFQNMVGNAIKFHAERTPEIHIGAERKDGEWLISVRDNGIGIDPEYKDRIFVIFQRLHGAHEHEGTGIGLAVCKKIVERHRGSIWVESELGEGSTFYISLPAKGADT